MWDGRVLMLATYFPRPDNTIMGNWALSQAQAFQRQGLEVLVVSATPWVPQWLSGMRRGAAAFAHCPVQVNWDSLSVLYPRALWYPVGICKTQAFRSPSIQMDLAWRTCKRSLLNAVETFRPSVVYAHHSAVSGYFAERLSQLRHIPYVITDHDFEEIAACGKWHSRKRFFEPITQHASMLVSVASRMEVEMKRLFPQAHTCTVHAGTDLIPSELQRNTRPADLDGKLVLFSCGAFYERKGFPMLIEAFGRVSTKHPNVILRIVGDGYQRPEIEDAIRRCSLGSRVELLGRLPSHRDVLQEMCWCDAFALIGWDEPFATVFIEAMSAGKPVICCNDGGINDVVKNEVHGLTVPPHCVEAAAEALDRILSDSSLRTRLGQNARSLVESSLTWDHNASTMAAIFERATTTVMSGSL